MTMRHKYLEQPCKAVDLPVGLCYTVNGLNKAPIVYKVNKLLR